MTIALLCPTRGRPEQFKRMIESAYSTATKENIQVFVALDKHDFETYPKDALDKAAKVLIMPDLVPTGYLFNKLSMKAYKREGIKIFMLAADDMVFTTPCWDEALLNHYNALGNKIHVYHLQDSRDANGTPHPIATREYIEALGYFVSPIFMHWFADTWTVEIARANGCFTHMRDYLLIHDKPSDQGRPDDTFARLRLGGVHERDVWVSHVCQWVLEHEKQKLGELMK